MGSHRPLFGPTPRTPKSRKPAYLGASGLVSRVGLDRNQDRGLRVDLENGTRSRREMGSADLALQDLGKQNIQSGHDPPYGPSTKTVSAANSPKYKLKVRPSARVRCTVPTGTVTASQGSRRGVRPSAKAVILDSASRLPRHSLIPHRRVISEARHHSSVNHQVAGKKFVEGVHVEVVRSGPIVDPVLQELEAGQSRLVEG